MPRLSSENLLALKQARPLDELIGARVRLGRANAKGVRAGACLCAPAKGKAPLWVNATKGTWGCLKGGCGGDVFSYLEQFDGLSFLAACEFLGGHAATADPKALARAAAERERRAEERALREATLAEEERRKAYAIWQRGAPIAGTPAEAYFALRGLALPHTKALRFSAEEPYFFVPDGAGARPLLVHSGPCLLAAIQAPDGRFLGLHRTWIDPRPGTKGKAAIEAPDGALLPAKKMRGAKQGGAIRLHDFGAGVGAKVLLAGEGIETVETVYQAFHKYPLAGESYAAWAAGDLGNLAGCGLGPSCLHPENPQKRVPSDEPDMSEPGMVPPPGTTRAILLGDGDSDPFVTGAYLRRAQRRWSVAQKIPVEIRMAPAGTDFNDMARRSRYSERSPDEKRSRCSVGSPDQVARS